MTLATSPALAAALDLAGHGVPVFPLKPRSKVPATENGFKDASVDGGILHRRFIAAGTEANIGVACGGWGFVLDSDGPEAREWLDAKEAKHGPLPETWTVRTSRGGHRYFRCSTPVANVPKDQLATAVEIKGVGGYVVAPPSIHPDGRPYKWLIGPNDLPQPALAPPWLIDLLIQHQAEKSIKAAEPISEVIPNGERNSTLASLAGTMRRRGLSEAAIVAALLEENAIRCRPPLDDAEVRTIAASVARYKPETGGRIIGPNGSGAAQAEKSASLPWKTAAEIAQNTPAEIDWFWDGYLAMSTVVEFDAKLKTGKTTFTGHLVRHLLTGDTFLGRPTMSAPVVWMTEEGSRTFRAMLSRSGLTDRHDLHVLSKREVVGLDWEQLVAAAKVKLLETGAGVLIVDTLGKLAGFRDEDENISGKAMEAMSPLQALASELSVVVIVVRHDRKAGGEIGDSARGSSAFGGDADVILHLTRVGGKGRERRRYLDAVGRFDETPERITIELTADGYRVISETDALDAAAAAVLAVLPDLADDAVAVVDLLDDLKAAGHIRTHVYAAVDKLLTEGTVQTGKVKGPSGRFRKVLWLQSSNGGT